jgi:SOS-response transcriptional repressor LexA
MLPSLKKITAEDILSAIERFNAMGRVKFNRFTGEIAKCYFIEYQGKSYDCKSIVVGAYFIKNNARKFPSIHSLSVSIDLIPFLNALGFKVLLMG